MMDALMLMSEFESKTDRSLSVTRPSGLRGGVLEATYSRCPNPR